MASIHSCRQQTKRRDDRKIDIVLHRHELGLGFLIQSRDRGGVPRIDLLNLRVLINNLRFVIPHLVDLVRNFVVIRLRNHDADQFFATESDTVALNSFARAPLIRKRIE